MYSVRLLLRSFTREVSSLDYRLAHSGNSRTKEQIERRNKYENKSSERAKGRDQFQAEHNFVHSKESGSRYPRRRRLESDQLAGIRRQADVMGYTHEEMNQLGDIEDDEVNISMAERIYDAHMGEMRWNARKHSLAAYGQKYYKQKQEPALLSWEDMEQIRKLHLEDKWPFSVLAKSFPANELIIEKVIKSKWNPSLEMQYNHDKNVAQNWILLRKGKLEISDELKMHCLKFANRVARPMTSKDIAIINKKPSYPPGAFLSLIHPSDKHKTQSNKESDPDQSKEESDFDQSTKEVDRDHSSTWKSEGILKHLREKITLEEVRKKELEHIADQGNRVTEDDKLFVCGSEPSRDDSSQGTEKLEYINPSMYAEKSVGTKAEANDFVSKWDSSGNSVNALRQFMMSPYENVPERINIPEIAKKPGAIYRVEDCFYDENGEFMYRVPGLKL